MQPLASSNLSKQSDSSYRLKVLLVIEECNPEWASVPLVGYRFYEGISQFVDTTLVTHQRNYPALEKVRNGRNIVYFSESSLAKRYYQFVERITRFKGRTIWPLYNSLNYPIHAEFNHKVYQAFREDVLAGKYDLVHALTPMMPRYPVKLIKACQKIPFVLGPVNGGVPFPKGFGKVARQEFAYFNFLRALSRLIPGYLETYRKAAKVLAGSTYTLNTLKETLGLLDDRIELFYENGITANFFDESIIRYPKEHVNLLFVGRLVPYKGADMAIDALSHLNAIFPKKVSLTIVGEGPEKEALRTQARDLGIQDQINFAGWVEQQETLRFYREADIFCFPSIREFGGAVVLEAMACGLPCVVVNNGGIGEYVTEETGFKIEPISREFLVQGLVEKLQFLIENPELRQKMSVASVERARSLEWTQKAKDIIKLYTQLVGEATSVGAKS